MNEVDVTLTDYALALECAIFVFVLLRREASRLRNRFIFFFTMVSIASLAGGMAHGFFDAQDSLVHEVIWSITMLAFGLAMPFVWGIGAALIFSPQLARWISSLAWLETIVYSVAVLFISSKFEMAVVHQLPALLFLLGSSLVVFRRQRSPGSIWLVMGLSIMLAGSAAQQMRVSLHPVLFTHNAVYHVIEIVGLFGVFRATKDLKARGS